MCGSARMKKIKTLHIRNGQFFAKIGYLKILFPPFPLYPRSLKFWYKVKLGQKSKSSAPFFEIFFRFENIALPNFWPRDFFNIHKKGAEILIISQIFTYSFNLNLLGWRGSGGNGFLVLCWNSAIFTEHIS